MKRRLKCCLYFAAVLVFLFLLLLDFLLTRSNDGFARFKAQYGVKLEPLFCFEAQTRAEACERDPRFGKEQCQQLEAAKSQCLKQVQDHEARIRDACSTQLFVLYTCSQRNGILESKAGGLRGLGVQACKTEIEATLTCMRNAME